MSGRKYDIVVFGATGFTGERVFAYLLSATPKEQHDRYAIAGRDAARLHAVLTKYDGVTCGTISGVDVNVAESIASMVRSARMVLNCVGPFRLYGEPVFAACAAEGSDYLDVCGEPEFIERMELRYGAAAAASGALMASAVGFDSIPAEVGTQFAVDAFTPPAAAASVESALQLTVGPAGAAVNYGTWESAVRGIGSTKSLAAVRAEVKAAKGPPTKRPKGPRPKMPKGFAWDERFGAYVTAFPGADASVVRRGQAQAAERGREVVHYTALLSVQSRWNMLLLAAYGSLFKALAGTQWGASTLLARPGLFSHGVFTWQGPSEEQMAQSGFKMHFVAKGYSSAEVQGKPDVEIRTCVSGPEIGYVATPIFLVQAALTVLEERHGAALKALSPGGVFTAGTLLHGTTYRARLESAGIKFTVTKAALPPAAAPP